MTINLDAMTPSSGRVAGESDVVNVASEFFSGIRAAPYESQVNFAGAGGDETLSFSSNAWTCYVWWCAKGLRERFAHFTIKTTNAVNITVTWYGNEIPDYGNNGELAGAYSETSTIATGANAWVSFIIPIPLDYPYVSFKLTADEDPGSTVARIYGYGIG